ncbi:glutamine--fructose-6-phosphate transaminase (isomerizing) [Mycolicibacterium diernhoferi]|uniref:Glutamine--fructose-6-phosphate aminotransferase [isomerizing] n=1 Tax=Mycolicibacterium diernhoferi TaxID=1801 RepID=A0A1Q4HDE4_9MYCO|nr:glutamine--fructose-6-phosphate transaminase (isomerizing) [Mycolicibacterium diernhoferi]OJZ65559.1 glutamine--fructose-6-phosphate transaminase (isomerizing) [Mycolicibacterium diernhoferi]OPE56253.1 glutamine--fructose-6-phosphate transaminase (isomerizing) [Mycolicibacterium diernhoferi]PEG55934.1 glutamine--fructose-6-phosphate transaminase (isomerizing) [Mycolicibacterium diernhoferi]QYL22301.1 glutamine--fructose-6-phosphate transaminase (isomerizing) [Mycolicibacterium diernhoferi]
MCGIIACRTAESAADYLRIGLRRLEYRGYDSVGVAIQTATGDIARVRTIERIDTLDRLLADWSGPAFAGAGLGHTRWATHGSVTESNAHPHNDCEDRISLVHNGIIDNADTLRASLTIAGHSFDSDVDSEVLCHLIEDRLQLCGDLFEAVRLALVEVEGSWGLAVLERGTGRIVVAANRCPLLVAHTPDGAFATSDIAAIADWVDEFRVLEDGDIVDLVSPPRWSRQEGIGASLPPVHRCAWRSTDAELNGYADHMAKEIDEQAELVSGALDSYGSRIADGSLWAEYGMEPFERLHVVGCGTSLNAGRVIANLVRRLGGIPVRCSTASEVADEIAEPGTLSLAISQSGETTDVLRALETPAVCETPMLALTNSAHSALARRADAVMLCGAGPEIGVAATKTFICQIVAGTALMISALVGMGRLTRAAAVDLVDDLRYLPDRLGHAGVKAKCVVPRIAEEISSASGMIFIARGNGIPYAAEGALKVKELTYCWAEHHSAGELKHGPLALIGVGTVVIVVDNDDPRLRANIAEVQSRGGRIVSIGRYADSTVQVASIPSAPWGPIESTVPLQILARSMAMSLGRDVDKPRNLAKSVTVE